MIIALIETIMMDYTLSCPAGQLLMNKNPDSGAIEFPIYNCEEQGFV
jgi:hypothetical protein